MSEQIVVSVDASEITSMNLCPERWNLEHQGHWRSNRKAKALDMGTIMHAMLAHYYRNRIDGFDKNGKLVRPKRTAPSQQSTLIQECLKIGETLSLEALTVGMEVWEETIARVFKEYILWYQHDGWEVLSVERAFTVKLYESPKLLINLTGITDLIVKDVSRGLLIVDTKTEARRSDPYLLSNQFQAYYFASGNRPIIVNKVGWQKDSTPIEQRFRRIELTYSEELQREWKNDTIRQVIESIGWKQELDKGKRLMKNRSSCDKFTGCTYRMVCKEPSDVREHILLTNFHKKVWDPHMVGKEELFEVEESVA